jgi:hypothetical protein
VILRSIFFIITRGLECEMCHEPVSQIETFHVTCCNKNFHWKCVFPWIQENESCPECKAFLPLNFKIMSGMSSLNYSS